MILEKIFLGMAFLTPKNPFQDRRGAYILLRKMFSGMVLYTPKPLLDRILVTDMRMQASSLLAEYRIKEQPPQKEGK